MSNSLILRTIICLFIVVPSKAITASMGSDFSATFFNEHCVLCHGQYGKGDGRMSIIITDPPPANLSLSKMPRANLAEIIGLGGAAVGRSSQMPPWGEQLDQEQIEALVTYIINLRVKSP